MQYGNPEEDSFYETRGAKPPERIPHLTEEEMEAKFEANRRRRNCEYRQRGIDIFCINCPQRHGKLVSPHLRLTGTNDSGLPIFEKVVLSKYSVRPALSGKSDAQLKRVR
jgi:hypothetical protein